MKNKNVCENCTKKLNISSDFFEDNWKMNIVYCPSGIYKDEYCSINKLKMQTTKEKPDKKTCKYYLEHLVSLKV